MIESDKGYTALLIPQLWIQDRKAVETLRLSLTDSPIPIVADELVRARANHALTRLINLHRRRLGENFTRSDLVSDILSYLSYPDCCKRSIYIQAPSYYLHALKS